MAMDGTVRATIGADIGEYKKAMAQVSELTTKAFNEAKRASETGGNGMMRAVKAALGALNALIPSKLSGLGRNMVDMFNCANAFNQPLASWDVRNVNNMSRMFSGAFLFNQPLASWDIRNVISMTGMFSYTWAFNQPLSSWDFSNVLSMSSMGMSAL